MAKQTDPMDVFNYNTAFADKKKWPRIQGSDVKTWMDAKWEMQAIWILGNDYRSKHGYYGEYPPGYLDRMRHLFPHAQRVLHLFAGMVEKGIWPDEVTLDANRDLNPDVCVDVSKVKNWTSRKPLRKKFDVVFADPPYTGEDAEHYGRPLVARNTVVKQCLEIVRKGGYLVWLDQVLPMFRKDEWHWCGAIPMLRSTNHRVRCVFIFRRL